MTIKSQLLKHQMQASVHWQHSKIKDHNLQDTNPAAAFAMSNALAHNNEPDKIERALLHVQSS